MLKVEKIFFILIFSLANLFRLPAQSGHLFKIERPGLGTTIRLIFYAEDSTQAAPTCQRAFFIVDSFNRILSDYQPDSEVNLLKVNPVKSWIPVSAPLYDILQKSIFLRNETSGSFNVAIGTLTHLWRHHLAHDQIPGSREIRAARKLLGKRKLALHPSDNTVSFLKKNMQLDFGGIGKGYIGDQMAGVLREGGISVFLIDLGGDLVAGEAPPGSKGWVIEVPWCEKKISIRNQSVATSGPDYQFHVYKGRRFSHILDPKTGWGVPDLFATTVIAPQGWLSDGLASAFSIMTKKSIYKTLKRNPDIAAIIGKENDLFESSGFFSFVISDSEK